MFLIRAAIHLRHFVAPFARRQGLIVTATFTQQKCDVFLPEDAHVEHERAHQGVDDDVRVHYAVKAHPGQEQEQPGRCHNQEQ